MHEQILRELISLVSGSRTPSIADKAALQKAYAFAVAAHAGQKYGKGKNAKLYHEHCTDVSSHLWACGAPHKVVVAGLLHDVLEDNLNITPELLAEAGFPEEVIAIVQTVTRNPGESYDAYIDRIADSRNVCAIGLKLVDLTVNLDNNPTAKQKAKYSKHAERLAKLCLELTSKDEAAPSHN